MGRVLGIAITSDLFLGVCTIIIIIAEDLGGVFGAMLQLKFPIDFKRGEQK